MKIFCIAFRRLLPGLVLILATGGCRDEPREPELLLLCAAGVRAPIEELAARFEEESGVPVRIQYGGSGTLLANLELSGADLFLSADPTYAEAAEEKGLVSQRFPLATMAAGLAVLEGNPKEVEGLEDLLREDLRVGIANPEAASIGRVTKEVLEAEKIWGQLEPAVTHPSVTDLATALRIGSIDLAVIWNVVAAQHDQIEWIPVERFQLVPQEVTIAIAVDAKFPEEAGQLGAYLRSREKGRPVFERFGFSFPMEQASE